MPFTIADATTLTEAGYVGEDVENIIQKLLQKCDYDVEKAQTGIVYIDEIDKISRKSRQPVDHPRRVGRGRAAGAAQADRGHHRLGAAAGRPQASAAGIPAGRHLATSCSSCGGAFSGLEKVILNRTQKGGIGFTSEVRSVNERPHGADLFHDVEPEDLIKFGLIPEFVGRLPVVATLEELDEAALISHPHRAEERADQAVPRACSRWKASSSSSATTRLRAVARKAMERKTGARGLRTILENVLLDTMYELPSLQERQQGGGRRDA